VRSLVAGSSSLAHREKNRKVKGEEGSGGGREGRLARVSRMWIKRREEGAGGSVAPWWLEEDHNASCLCPW
jgi:hypothetical protein